MDDNTLQLLARLDERTERIDETMKELPREDTVKLIIAQGITQHVEGYHKRVSIASKASVSLPVALYLKIGLVLAGMVGAAFGVNLAVF